MPGGTDGQCINGLPSGAFNPCTGNDGPGVAHDAFASSGFTIGALLLFTITYKVMASGSSSVRLPESTTGGTSENHLFDTSGIDIIASETGGQYGPVAAAFDYSLSNNGPVSIQAGSSGPVTITATLTAGSTQAVTLSCVSASLPAGITCGSFTVNPVTPTGSSVLTINVAASVAAGSYSFMVTGAPLGATTTPTTVSVTVTAVPFDYSLSNNGPVSVQQGASGTVTITATLKSGSGQSVTLSCVNPLPSGITCTSFNPPSVTPSSTGATSVLTIAVASSVASGSYSVQVTGAPLGATTTPTTVSITVTSVPFDYSLSNNGPVSTQQGSSGTVTITATLKAGTAQSVTLSCGTPLPSGIICISFNPPSVTPSSTGASSVLMISVASSVVAGSYSVMVTGAPLGATTTPTTVSITVTSVPFDYSLSNNGPVSIQQSSSGTVTITATLKAGTAQSVTLFCVTPLPSGITCTSFSPLSVTPSSTGASSVLTIAVASSVAPSSYSLQVTGTPLGATTTPTTVSITVTSVPFDYSLSNNGTVSIQQGSSGTATITATLKSGTAQSVTLSCVTPLPSGITCTSFNPPSVTPSSTGATSILAIAVASSVAPGSYSVQVTGAPLGATTTPTTVSITVTAVLFDYSLSNNGPVSIQQGSSGTVTITATLKAGTAQSVTLSCVTPLPSGITCTSFNPPSVTPSSTGASSVLTIAVASSVTSGSHTIQVTGSPLGATTTPATVSITVTSVPFDYSLSNNGPVSITQGSSGHITITATLTGGAAQAVTLSCVTPLPAGVSCSFVFPTVTPTGSGSADGLTISTSASTPTGPFTLVVNGSPVGATASGSTTSVSVTVTAVPFDYSLSNNGPVSITSGSSGTVTVTAMLTAGSAQSVTLSCVGSSLPAGITCGSFTVNPVTPTSAGASSDLKINVGSSVAAGSYSFDVTGNPLGATTTPTSVSITVTVVTGQPDFVLSASSTSLTVMGESSLCEGSSTLCDDEASTTVTVTSLNGFAGSVRLRFSVNPTEGTLTAYCSARAVFVKADGTSKTRCQVEPEINPDTPITYTVTIKATNGTVSRSLTITVTVTPNPFVPSEDNGNLSSALSAPLSANTAGSSAWRGAPPGHRHYPRTDETSYPTLTGMSLPEPTEQSMILQG